MKCLKNFNLRLTILLVLQIGLALFLWWPKASQTSISRNLFEGLQFGEINQIAIAEAGKEFTLEKKDQLWVVPQESGYPADEKKIRELIGNLESLKPGPAVGKTKTGHSRFEVSDEKFQRKVSLGKDGFYLGSSPRFRSTHIRRFGHDEVFTTEKLSTHEISTQPKDWLEKKLLVSRSEDITDIEIQRGKETLKFTRVEKPESKTGAEAKTAPERIWLLDGKPVEQSSFDAILRNLAEMRLTEVLGQEEKADYGLKNPQALLRITYQVGDKTEEKVFAVGKTLDNDVVVHRQDSPFYVKVAKYQLNAVLETQKKDLIPKN